MYNGIIAQATNNFKNSKDIYTFLLEKTTYNKNIQFKAINIVIIKLKLKFNYFIGIRNIRMKKI